MIQLKFTEFFDARCAQGRQHPGHNVRPLGMASCFFCVDVAIFVQSHPYVARASSSRWLTGSSPAGHAVTGRSELESIVGSGSHTTFMTIELEECLARSKRLADVRRLMLESEPFDVAAVHVELLRRKASTRNPRFRSQCVSR